MKNLVVISLFMILWVIPQVHGQINRQTSREEVSTKPDKTRPYDHFVNNQEDNRVVEVIDLPVEEILIYTKPEMMSRGQHTAIIINIPEGDFKEVEKGWEKLIKNKTKSKVEKEQDEISIDNTLIEPIYYEPINIYGKITQTEEGITLTSFVEIQNRFINDREDKDKITATREFLREFGVEQYKTGVRIQLEKEEDKLKEFNQNLNKLQRENEKLHKKIKENESNILNTESDIDMNMSDQHRKATELEKQKLYKSSVTGDDEREKEAKKALKDRSKERKKLQGENKDLHKSLAKYRADIEESRRAVQFNLDEQAIEKEAIKKQMVLIRAIENKIRKIH